MTKKFLNPDSLPQWDAFSQIVIIEGTGLTHISISGQVGVNKHHKLAGNDLESQLAQSFENLQEALRCANAKPEDVVQVRFYIVNYEPEHGTAITAAYKKIFTQRNLPAATWIGVKALALPGLLFEVEATAIIQS